MTTDLDRISRLPKAQLAQLVLAFAQGAPVPAPVDADVAPTPEAKPEKAQREMPCNVHALDVCNRKFWGTKGANDERHVARLS